MPTYTPEQYAQRDLALDDFMIRHRVVATRCAAAALGAGKPLTHALNRRVDSGDWIRHERVLPGGQTVYTLSTRGCARLGLPKDRAELPTGSALDMAIAVQAFTTLGRHPRHRLTAAEVTELFGTALPMNVPFVVSDELGDTKVFRVVHAVHRLPAEALRYVRTLVEQAERHAKLNRWVSGRQLGFALLGPAAASVAALRRLADRSGLMQRVALVIDIGPDVESYAQVAKRGGGSASS